MAKVVKRTFSLTEEQAKFIDRKVEEGRYASGSEIVREGLRGLQEDEVIFERWLRTEVVQVLDRVQSGGEKTYTAAEVRKRLQRQFHKLAKAAE